MDASEKLTPGTTVKVESVKDGEPVVLTGGVIEHGDGIVHVEVDGEVMSVHPSQIVSVEVMPTDEATEQRITNLKDVIGSSQEESA